MELVNNMKDYPDSDLVYHLNDSEEATDILYEKYKYIIDIVIKKYTKAAYLYNIELAELRQEAMFAFSDALYRYKDNKDASLATFITLVIERRIRRVIDSASTLKNRINVDALSLEYTYSDFGNPLMYILGDDSLEPLKNIEDKESTLELLEKLQTVLSESELEVCNLLLKQYDYKTIAETLEKSPKQIDNTIQRIRNKIKKIL